MKQDGEDCRELGRKEKENVGEKLKKKMKLLSYIRKERKMKHGKKRERKCLYCKKPLSKPKEYSQGYHDKCYMKNYHLQLAFEKLKSRR